MKTDWQHHYKFFQAIAAFFAPIVLIGVGVGLTVLVSIMPVHAQTSAFIPSGVGGIIAPGACPPAGLGDCDTLTFTPDCGAVIGIVGPYGSNWGLYQWDMPPTEPPIGPPYDEWDASYLTNGFPYTHAGEFMVGYAIPSLDPEICPLPMLISIGTSLFK